jgi:hypothetical protein
MAGDMTMDLMDDAAGRAARYLRGLAERPIWPDDAALAGLDRFIEPLQRDSVAPEAVLAMLDEFGSPATVANAGPRYFGYVVGGALPASVAANWLASAWDQNAHHWAGSPIGTRLEEVVLNQVLVSFGDAGRTQRIIAAVQAEGTCWCSGTVWQGQSAMRISVSSWATTTDDVERSLAAILRIAATTT